MLNGNADNFMTPLFSGPNNGTLMFCRGLGTKRSNHIVYWCKSHFQVLIHLISWPNRRLFFFTYGRAKMFVEYTFSSMNSRLRCIRSCKDKNRTGPNSLRYLQTKRRLNIFNRENSMYRTGCTAL